MGIFKVEFVVGTVGLPRVLGEVPVSILYGRLELRSEEIWDVRGR